MSTRVLVVDDELDTLNLLKTLLEITGFEPVTTLNSMDAMTLAEIEKPDVALLDIMMPALDGFALCKMIRSNDKTRHLPVIFVTAYGALDLEDRRREAGADYVIHKPIDIDLLIATINTIHDIRRAATADTATPPAKVEAEPTVPAVEIPTKTGDMPMQTATTPVNPTRPRMESPGKSEPPDAG